MPDCKMSILKWNLYIRFLNNHLIVQSKLDFIELKTQPPDNGWGLFDMMGGAFMKISKGSLTVLKIF